VENVPVTQTHMLKAQTTIETPLEDASWSELLKLKFGNHR